MQTQTTGTATMTAMTATAAGGRRLIVNPTTGTCSFDDRAGAEFRAQEAECDRRRAVYEHRDGLLAAGMTWAEAGAACEARLAAVEAEYRAEMARIEEAFK